MKIYISYRISFNPWLWNQPGLSPFQLHSHTVCVYVCRSVFMHSCTLADAQKSSAPLSIWEFGLKSRMCSLEQPQTSHSQHGDGRSLANWYSFSSSLTKAPAEEIRCSLFSISSLLSSSSPVWPNLSVADKNQTNRRSSSIKLIASWLASDLFLPLTLSFHSLLLFDLPIQCFPPLSPPFISFLTHYKI